MKKRVCCYGDCGTRRVHHERQDVPRGTQMVQVADDYPDDRPCYCSITCACMDGAMAVSTSYPLDTHTKSGYKVPDRTK